MSTGSKGPRNETTHQSILDAAREILQKEGNSRFTIEKIARLSGAGKPTIYRWWPNKTAILIELFNRETVHFLQISDTGSTRDEVYAWFRGVWDMWQSSIGGEAFRTIIAEVQTDPQAMDYFHKSFIERRRALLTDILKRAQARGELANRNPEVIVDYCWGFNWYNLLTGSIPTDEAIREVVDTISTPAQRSTNRPK